MLEKNPYKLIEDVKGIGFQRADELGRKLGLGGNHPERIRAAILYTLDAESIRGGNVYVEWDELAQKTRGLLLESDPSPVLVEEVEREITALSDLDKVVMENSRIYLPSLYFAESGFAHHMKRIMKQTEYAEQFPESEFLLALGELEERIGVSYGSSQKEALKTALMSPMLALTGGPGTGKTTVIKGIVELYSELNGVSSIRMRIKMAISFQFCLRHQLVVPQNA
ncbi:RecD/TraA family helicase [Listeria floridensis FSL S10-1187]|uniref:RecD/TraA family helicase n=1 Tax=Listeria floridensis FSL S10-1187 TaxID=1265817 RepID=A0ABN0RC62_9LIST|nr:RecD/TraA family helicase [Listeria floridensis FSL S10-1187]